MAPWVLRAATVGIPAILFAPQVSADADLIVLIRAGRPGEVVTRLENTAAREMWVHNPAGLERLCACAADCKEELASAGRDGERLVAVLEEMAAACVAAMPESVPALYARAHAGLAWAERMAAPGRPGAEDRWRSVARDYEEAFTRSESDLTLAWWAAYALTRAAECDGSGKVPSFDRADELLARFRKGREQDPEATAHTVTLWLERARVVAARRKPASEEIVSNALEALGAAEKMHPDDRRLDTARNEVARAVRLLRLPRPKVDFVFYTGLVGDGLEIDVPRGLRWTEPEGRGQPIWQSSMAYRQIRCFSFVEFDWDSAVVFGDRQETEGANIQGLADGRFAQLCAALKEIRSKSPPRRATLKRCNPGWYFEVEGKDSQGSYARHRAWFFKSTKGQLKTFELLVSCSREGEPDDPEFQFVLDSLREKKRD